MFPCTGASKHALEQRFPFGGARSSHPLGVREELASFTADGRYC